MRKPRIIWWSVAPWAKTGYGKVTYNICKRLQGDFDVRILAFTGLHFGSIEWEGFKVYPPLSIYDDHAIRSVHYYYRKLNADLVIQHFDLWTINDEIRVPFVAYTPIDQEPLSPLLIRHLNNAVGIFAMSRYAQGILKREGFDSVYLPHGCDTSIFKPMDKLKCREYFGLPKDAFIYLCVACYDSETEVLTKGGWKKIGEITYDDEIATLNQNGYLEWHRPSAIWRYWYDGVMYHFKGRFIDLLVTPEHRMYVRPRWRNRYIIKLAEEIANLNAPQMYLFKRNCKWKGEQPTQTFKLPLLPEQEEMPKRMEIYRKAMELYEKEGLTIYRIARILNIPVSRIRNWVYIGEGPPENDARVGKPLEFPIELWLEFFGWYLAEGSVDKKRKKVAIAQRNEKNIKAICNLLDKMGLRYYINKTSGQIEIKNKQLCYYLSQFGKANEKFIPTWIKNLPPSMLRILFDAMMRGDGDSRGRCYFTTSKRLADDFMEIAIKLGYGVTCRKVPPKHQNHSAKYVIGLTRGGQRNYLETSATRVEKVYYRGWVYDVTVPNHVLLVRRNGKVVWCGNSNHGPRKNIPALLKAFAMFVNRERISPDECILLLHTYVHKDVHNPTGYELPYIWQYLGIEGYVKHTNPMEYLIGFTEEEMAMLYNCADVFILPSCGEGFGIPLVESMACGLPVIGTEFSSIPEIIRGAGLTVRVAEYICWDRTLGWAAVIDTEDLAEKHAKLYYDERLREKLGRAGIRRAKLYEWDRIVERFLKPALHMWLGEG